MLGHRLVLNISTPESPAPIERIIPLLDDPVDDTLVFSVKHPEQTVIVFQIRKMGADQSDHHALIGTGMAFLSTATACLAARHGTLVREKTRRFCVKTP